MFGRLKTRSGLFTSRKTYRTPNEITYLMEINGHQFQMKAHAMWLSKFLKRSTKSGKVKITGKGEGEGGFGLELPTLRAVISPAVVTLRKGFSVSFVA